MIILSLNEVEQLCQKAARGAGLSWGLAEEAGMAAAWLVKQGIDGPKRLCRRLQKSGLGAPMQPWGTQDQAQCPIALGAALCDHAQLVQTDLKDAAISLGRVADPVLLLPFLARMSAIKGHSIVMTWGQFSAVIGPAGVIAPKSFDDGAPSAVVQIDKSVVNIPPFLPDPYQTDEATIQSLGDFAIHTTVPASALSRAGAGADDE